MDWAYLVWQVIIELILWPVGGRKPRQGAPKLPDQPKN